MRLPFFCIDLLHDFDFKIALGQELLEAAIFPFEFGQPRRVGRLHAAVPAAPAVERCFTNRMLATQCLDGRLSRFCLAQDGNDLRFSKSTGLPCLLLVPLDLFSHKQWTEYYASGQ